MGLMVLESDCYFSDDFNDDASDIGGSNYAKKAANFGVTIFDDGNELEDDFIGTVVIVAMVELWNDIVALAAEDDELGLDLDAGPLRNDLWNSAGEGDSTGSKDSEDGGKTHCEE